MKGYYLQFRNVHFGKMFNSFEAAKNYAEGMNAVSQFPCLYTITVI